jgi:hypothetical protein
LGCKRSHVQVVSLRPIEEAGFRSSDSRFSQYDGHAVILKEAEFNLLNSAFKC